MKRPLLRALDRAGLLLPVYRTYERLRALAARPADAEAPADGLAVPPPRRFRCSS